MGGKTMRLCLDAVCAKQPCGAWAWGPFEPLTLFILPLPACFCPLTTTPTGPFGFPETFGLLGICRDHKVYGESEIVGYRSTTRIGIQSPYF